MPRVILSFTLPEEESELKMAERGRDYYCALIEIQRVVRDHHKYGKKLPQAFTEIERIVQDSQTEDIP